jgi:hypothetical protein
MAITIGKIQDFLIEKYDSQFTIPSIECYFCDDLANLYKPIIYGGDYSDPEPEGIYYRILYKPGLNRLCLQYYVYWLDQNCLGLLPIADHKYDYEPIFIYIQSPKEFPVGIVNAGYSRGLGMSCRFHKTEIRMEEFRTRDFNEDEFSYKTSPEPFYPFGGSDGLNGSTCVKKYPIAGAVYLNELQPMFGITSCSHVFSGAEKELRGSVLSIPLKRLDDRILNEWYFEHHKDAKEEPFGHDVSDAFVFPYIKYSDPKPFLRSSTI